MFDEIPRKASYLHFSSQMIERITLVKTKLSLATNSFFRREHFISSHFVSRIIMLKFDITQLKIRDVPLLSASHRMELNSCSKLGKVWSKFVVLEEKNSKLFNFNMCCIKIDFVLRPP